MSEENRLRIHAQITPARQIVPDPEKNGRSFFRRRFLRESKTSGSRLQPPEKKLSPTDRFLRNSALACSLLLAVLAMGNLNQPWAIRSSEAVRRALTMHIDLDDSIGRLSFVRNILPESALVFLNVSARSELEPPVSGELTHAYFEDQPWLLFSCEPGTNVLCAADGTVTAVSELSGGVKGLLVDHGNGVESVYAYLEQASVRSGDSVLRGQILGQSGPQLYYELRESEVPVDPTGKMGLSS